MRRIGRVSVAGVTTVVFWCGLSPCQSAPPVPSSVDSASITVPFIAEDSHQNATVDITPGELLVLDKQKRQQVIANIHTSKDLPLRFGLLIDTSNSAGHGDLYAPAIKAAFDFLKQVLTGPDDMAFVMQFEYGGEATKFLSREEISNLKIELVTGGATALFDAVNLACRERMMPDAAYPARRVLFILSDGDDNVSHISRSDAVATAEQAGTLIFAIDTGGFGGASSKGRKILERMADATGGRVFQAMGRKDIEKDFVTLGSLLDHMQSVTFVPIGPTPTVSPARSN